jgi:hypothetical protein
MKKSALLFIVSVIFLVFGCNKNQADSEIEINKAIAARYHNLNPADIDSILTDNFTGHRNNLFTWDKENHRNYLSNTNFKQDSIFLQFAEGNWVATRFLRKVFINADTIRVAVMHFKRFENGKIAEIWEYYDTQQIPAE